MDVALSTVNDEQKLKELTENIAKLAFARFCENHRTGGFKLAEAKEPINRSKKQIKDYRIAHRLK